MTDLDALLALAAEAERLIAKECHSLVDSPALCSAVRELAAEVRRLRPLDGNDDHPENRCERCGGRNVRWYADSDKWNAYSGNDSILCPICFVLAADECMGVKRPASWRIALPDDSDEAQSLMVRMHRAQEDVARLTALLPVDVTPAPGSTGEARE